MKKLMYLLLLPLLFINCKSDDDTPNNPVDQLPPATQTGQQTFGCLINGEPFVPPSFGYNAPHAFYQFVNGDYTLGIYGSIGNGSNLKSISVGALDILELLEETSYPLLNEEAGNYYGQYLIGGGIVFKGLTSNQFPGNLTITHFDDTNYIISGTFSFTVIDNEGNEIKITEGRFDMNYTN